MNYLQYTRFTVTALILPLVFSESGFSKTPAKLRNHPYQVVIERDLRGVPHVIGVRDVDAAFGLAYAQAEDHWSLIESAIPFYRGNRASFVGKQAAPTDFIVKWLDIWGAIESGYERINRSIDESSYLLGYSKIKTFLGIHVPYLKNSVFLIGILITIEVIKELPITLILRPFNFETFATTAYIFASQDLLEAAAVPSLFLILIASTFILITSKFILKD